MLVDRPRRVRVSEEFGLMPGSWENEGAIRQDRELQRWFIESFVFGGAG